MKQNFLLIRTVSFDYITIYKQRRNLKRADINNTFVGRNLKTNRNFNFKDCKMLLFIK